MPERTPGCYYCFGSFIADADESSVSALACRRCGAIYHPECWQSVPDCSRCRNANGQSTIVAVSPPLVVIEKRRQQPIQPTSVMYLVGPWAFPAVQVHLVLLVSTLAFVGTGVLLGCLLVSLLPSLFTSPVASGSPAGGQLPPTSFPSEIIPKPSDTPALPTPPPVLIPSGMGRIQLQDVHLRAAPGPDEASLSIIRRGTQVQILNEIHTVGDSIWVKVQVDRLLVGWINQRYLASITPEDQEVARARVVGVAPEALRVRAAPDLSAEIVDRLSEGAELTLLEERDVDGRRWQYVQVDQTEGWVDASYLAPLP